MGQPSGDSGIRCYLAKLPTAAIAAGSRRKLKRGKRE